MISPDEKFFINRHNSHNNMYFDSDVQFSLYTGDFRCPSFDLNFENPAVDDIDLFETLQENSFNPRDDTISDTLSLKLNSEISEIRS